MSLFYDSERSVWRCDVKKSRKDNPVVKRGDSYIWIKRDSFQKKEYFKNEEELNKKYPKKTFEDFWRREIKLLKKYKKELKKNPSMSPVYFLKNKI